MTLQAKVHVYPEVLAKMKASRRRILVVLGLLPVAAHAYVDPGSGLLLWQGLIALVGAIIVFVRHPVQAIKAILKRWFGK